MEKWEEDTWIMRCGLSLGLRLAASLRALRYAVSQRLASVFLNVSHMDSFSVLYTRYFSARINEVVRCARLWSKAFNVLTERFRRHIRHVFALDKV